MPTTYMTERAALLRKAAAERSRKRDGGLKGKVLYLCSYCRLEHEGPGHNAGCPRCGRRSQTGADRPEAG